MITVIVATYGGLEWSVLANERAAPSVDGNWDGQMVIWHEPDGTRATSLNNAAAQATGDWLIFLDADDELAPGYVEAMRQAAVDSEHTTLFTPAVQQIRKGTPAAPFFFPECRFETGNWLVIGTMISRALFTEIGGVREHPHGLEDWNLWARAVRAGATVVKVPDAVYRAYANPQSSHRKLQRSRREYMVAYEVARKDAWG